MEEDEGAPVEAGYPTWHEMRSHGMALLWIGVILLIVAWWLAPEAPTNDNPYLLSAQLDRFKVMLNIYLFTSWTASGMVVGGFFMWLAGRVIDAFRHPKFF